MQEMQFVYWDSEHNGTKVIGRGGLRFRSWERTASVKLSVRAGGKRTLEGLCYSLGLQCGIRPVSLLGGQGVVR